METSLSYLYRSLLACIATTAVVAAPFASLADDPVELALRTGESTVIKTPRLVRVAIGDGKIAGIVPVADREIVLNGKSAGRTSLFVWTADGRRTYDVTVRERGLDALHRMMQGAIGEGPVRVDEFDRSLVLNGSVETGEQLAALSTVVARFQSLADAEKYTIVNAVTVSKPLGPLQNELAGDPATAGVRIDPDAKGNVIVSGQVTNRATAEHVLSKVRALAGPYLSSDGHVVDRLETETTSQVDVKVYILEVDETGLKQLGVSLQSATFTQNGSYTLGQPQFPAVEAPSAPGKGFTIGSFFRTITLAPTLNLILTSGHARILSSPNLVTLPGHQADFLVGGEIPIPVASGPQQIAIEYKDFGVKLKVTPSILGNGSIDTVVAPEVSNLDFTDGVQLNGFVVPALKTSKLSTDVITKDGESIVLGGLLNRMEQRNVSKIPLLGDLPILGKLFRSTSYQNQQTDVVFVMTPSIITR
jgi:Flp pilus assembly secretin CpaC